MAEDSAAEMGRVLIVSHELAGPSVPHVYFVETQLRRKTYSFAPSLRLFQSTRKCLG